MIEIFCEIPSILSCEKTKVENSRYTVARISNIFTGYSWFLTPILVLYTLGRSSRALVTNFILEMTLLHCICNSNLDRQQLSVLLRINKKGGLL